MWTSFFCIKSGAVAIVSLIFARYFGSILISDLDINTNVDSDYRIKLLAITAIIGCSSLNIIGVEWVAKVQRAFLVSKIAAIAFVMLMGLYSATFGGTWPIALENLQNIYYIPPVDEISLFDVLAYFPTVGVAVVAALWAYAGFHILNYVAEELINPQKNIPISIVVSLTIVIICYVTANLSYFLVLPMEVIITSPAVAITVAQEVWGYWAAIVTALLGKCMIVK